MTYRFWLLAIQILGFKWAILAQERPIKEYELTISKKQVNITGKPKMGMTVNGTIPGPVLEFTEGEQAVIHVKNNMDVETSVHWHGLLLPNFQDGVPYLTTPPIKPGETFTYTFPLKQSGTYWYHSHTMLQEQSGVYGSIVIHPKERVQDYDDELVLMLSDWTDEKPLNVLRNLKRGNEWYGLKKGTATPLNRVVSQGAFGAQLNFWKQRMEGADIADVYYPAFLVNGKQMAEYPQFKPGEKIRLRIIDGAASTSFWMTFGGQSPVLIAADGLDVAPIEKRKTFISIAETYDYIITIPESGKIEFRAMAQDGSGEALAYFGQGDILKAEKLDRPDKIGMMKQMAKMDMKMGAHAIKFRPGKDERYAMKDEYGMQMDHMNMEDMKHVDSSKMDHSKMDHSKMNHQMSSMKDSSSSMKHHMKPMKMGENHKGMFSEYNYDYLKSSEKTSYDKDVPVKNILLNLTGNMNRYIWSFNGVPLSETDNIKINKDEVTRITFNNLTMMHHPLHLHGHFFRVINENGEYSPLKHTVNVPPMQEITIEFYGSEAGDWFFHCHVLYHMMSGMTRIFSYGTPRDDRMEPFAVDDIIKETDRYYGWSQLDVTSHMATFNYTASNMRNQFNAMAEYGWNENIEAEVSYEYYLHDYLRVFAGVNMENEMVDSLDDLETTVIGGIRYFTPYMFNLDVRLDNKLRPGISLDRDVMIFPRLVLFGEVEYQIDFGWVSDLPMQKNFDDEWVWNAGLEYLLGKNASLMASYDNRFGYGGGLRLRF